MYYGGVLRSGSTLWRAEISDSDRLIHGARRLCMKVTTQSHISQQLAIHVRVFRDLSDTEIPTGQIIPIRKCYKYILFLSEKHTTNNLISLVLFFQNGFSKFPDNLLLFGQKTVLIATNLR